MTKKLSALLLVASLSFSASVEDEKRVESFIKDTRTMVTNMFGEAGRDILLPAPDIMKAAGDNPFWLGLLVNTKLNKGTPLVFSDKFIFSSQQLIGIDEKDDVSWPETINSVNGELKKYLSKGYEETRAYLAQQAMKARKEYSPQCLNEKVVLSKKNPLVVACLDKFGEIEYEILDQKYYLPPKTGVILRSTMEVVADPDVVSSLKNAFEMLPKDNFIYVKNTDTPTENKVIVLDPNCQFCNEFYDNYQRYNFDTQSNWIILYASILPLKSTEQLDMTRSYIAEIQKAMSGKTDLESLKKIYASLELSVKPKMFELKKLEGDELNAEILKERVVLNQLDNQKATPVFINIGRLKGFNFSKKIPDYVKGTYE